MESILKKTRSLIKKNQVKKMNIINPGNLTNLWLESWDWDNPIEKNYKKIQNLVFKKLNVKR